MIWTLFRVGWKYKTIINIYYTRCVSSKDVYCPTNFLSERLSYFQRNPTNELHNRVDINRIRPARRPDPTKSRIRIRPKKLQSIIFSHNIQFRDILEPDPNPLKKNSTGAGSATLPVRDKSCRIITQSRWCHFYALKYGSTELCLEEFNLSSFLIPFRVLFLQYDYLEEYFTGSVIYGCILNQIIPINLKVFFRHWNRRCNEDWNITRPEVAKNTPT